MAASKFAQDIDILIQGLSTVEKPGDVGAITVFSSNAFPLIAGRKSKYYKPRHPFAGAGRLGDGRLVAFGHTGFISADYPNIKALNINCIKWCAKGKEQGEIKVAVCTKSQGNLDLVTALKATFDATLIDTDELNDEDKLRSFNVVLINNIAKVSDAKAIENLRSYVKQGGGLIAAGTGWSWKGGDIRTLYPGNKIYNEAGFGWSAGFVRCPIEDGASVYSTDREHLQLTHAKDAYAKLVQHLQDKEVIPEDELNQINSVIVDSLASIPDDHPIIEKAQRDFIAHFPNVKYPSPSNPIKDPVEQITLGLASKLFLTECAETCDVIDAALIREAACEFPGLIDANIERTKDHEVTLNVIAEGWYSTGVYAPPFEQITVKFLPEGVTTKSDYLTLQIGSHSDDVTRVGEWVRSPILVTSKIVYKGDSLVTFGNSFGGLIYVNHTGKADVGKLTLQISGGVLAPYFKLGVTTDEEWNTTIRHYKTPYGELETNKIIFTLPIDRLSKLENPTELLLHWDTAMDTFADFIGLPAEREKPFRFVSDVQIRNGYMHAGYPLMMKNDESVDTALSITKVKTNDAWGHYHEIGHNHQESPWTFQGTGEVTNNVMVLYVFETLLGISAAEARPDRFGPDVRKKVLEGYVNKGTKFAEWQDNPWIALSLYLQLREIFGWDAFKKVFRAYRAIPEKELPTTDTEKIDLWITTFSKTVGQNLVPLYKSWGIPVSESVGKALADLPETDQTILSPVS